MISILPMGLSADSAWIAQAGLTLILFTMLIAGVALLIFAARDLSRDLRRHFEKRLRRNGDAPHSRAA